MAATAPFMPLTAPMHTKKEGDISSAFVSLSTKTAEILPPRFAELKARLIQGHERELTAGWHRLLNALQAEIAVIEKHGSAVIPEIAFADLDHPSDEFIAEAKKRGTIVIRGVVPEQEARAWKEETEEYIKKNPSTKAFPASNPQVFELYWSPAQMKARTHPNMLAAQRFLMRFWHSDDPTAMVSSDHPISYPDRLRIRQPGDAQFALGPHVDGGSVERWEENGYGAGGVYNKIWQGKWEEFDPWESSCRLEAVSDLYEGLGACSVFRMFQAWLSLSHTGPGEGTLQVNPLLQMSIAYYLLRPFFRPTQDSHVFQDGVSNPQFLNPDNWTLEDPFSTLIHGANMKHGQELNSFLHPHLQLERSMVHVPRVRPGDYVAWHCDVIHAVDKVHRGTGDASVMYIPAAPLTVSNAESMVRQRAHFSQGIPAPDFPGGEGESNHVGRPDERVIASYSSDEGLRALGLKGWLEEEPGLSEGQTRVLKKANEILGF